MKHRSQLFCLAILGAMLLCLTFSGCATPPDQPADTLEEPQEEEQAAEPEKTGVKTPPPASTSRAAATAPKAVSQPAPVSRSITLPAGTAVKVVTSSLISTKTHQTGAPFTASLNEDLVANGLVVARRGSLVSGIISESDPGGRVKGVASIALKLSQLTLADGQEVAIATSTYGVQAKTTKKKDATKIGLGAGLGAAIGAIAGGGKGAAIGAGVGGAAGTGAALATHGDPAEVAGESLITFELLSPVQATLK